MPQSVFQAYLHTDLTKRTGKYVQKLFEAVWILLGILSPLLL